MAIKKRANEKNTASSSVANKMLKKRLEPKTKSKSVVNTKASIYKQAPLKISKKAYTKNALLSALADRTTLSKKDVAKILEQLNVIIGGHLKKGGPGKFMLFALVKISVKDVAAKKARKGLHPLTKEQIIFKAKPAARSVKATALKLLKTMVI